MFTNVSADENKIHLGMAITSATNSAVIHLAVTRIMTVRICDTWNVMVDQATAATMTQPRAKATDLSFTAPDGEIIIIKLTFHELLLSRHVKINQESVILFPATSRPKCWCHKTGNRWWISFGGEWGIKNEIMEMLPKHMELWSGGLETLEAQHSTITFEEGTRTIRQQLYSVG